MDTFTSSSPTDALARKNLTVILNRLASTGQSRVAEALGKDESTVSRMKETHLPLLAQMLAAIGLKVVMTGVRTVEPETLRVLKRLAIAHLNADEDTE